MFDSIFSVYKFIRQEKSERIQGFLDSLNNLLTCLNEIIEPLDNGDRNSISQEELEAINSYIERMVDQFQDTPLRRDIEAIAESLREFNSRPATLDDLSTLKGVKITIISLATKINFTNSRGRRKFLYFLNLLILAFFSAGISLILWNIPNGKNGNSPNPVVSTPPRNSTKPSKTNDLTIVEQFPDLNENPWKMKSFLGEGYENQILYSPPEKVKQLVSEMTYGRFKIEISYPKKEDYQQGYSTLELLNKVEGKNEKEKIDAAYSGIYYENTNLALYFSCAIPFGLTPQEQIAWLNYKKKGEEKKYIQELIEQEYSNILIFPVACTGMQMGGWFQKEIKEIGDFRGIKMRIPGIGKKILQKDDFGIEVICKVSDMAGCKTEARIPGHDIIDRLISGELDAAEWIGPHEDCQLGIHNLSIDLTNKNKWYYYYPGWWEPSSTFSIHVNKNSWEQLPKTYQAIFESACSRVLYETLAEYNEKNGTALADLTEKYEGKISVKRFSPEILKAAEEATLNYFINSQAQDFNPVWKEFQEFKRKIRPWSKMEAYYTNYEDFLDQEDCKNKVEKL